MKGVSVIICCYNSVARLPETLKHLHVQKLNDTLTWELIIVDNHSTDGTAVFAEKYWDRLENGVPLQIVAEEKPGLSFARQRGVAVAKYDILIFCDDDNWLDADYLQLAYDRMEQDPSIGVLGGCSDAVFETAAPAWWATFQNAYAVGKPLPGTGNADARGYIAGAGMVTRARIFRELAACHFQTTNTDRTKQQLLSGGDTEFCHAVRYLGYHLYYDACLHFVHYMPATRLEWRYCRQMLTYGHAIPQLHLFFYQYCHYRLRSHKEVDFETTYKTLLKKNMRNAWYAWLAVKPFVFKLTGLFYTREGNKKELALRAQLNKLMYTWRHKQPLQQTFVTIEKFARAALEWEEQKESKLHIQKTEE